MDKSFQQLIFVQVSHFSERRKLSSLSKFLFFTEPELNRSRSTREDIRNHSTTSRQTPPYHHSYSTSSASTRASKMQSHILRRLASMRTTGTTSTSSSTGNSNGSNNTSNNNGSGSSTIDRILFDQMIDLSSIPIDLSTGINHTKNTFALYLPF